MTINKTMRKLFIALDRDIKFELKVTQQIDTKLY